MKKKTNNDDIKMPIFKKKEKKSKKGNKQTPPLKSPKETKYCKYCTSYSKSFCDFKKNFVQRKSTCEEWIISRKFK